MITYGVATRTNVGATESFFSERQRQILGLPTGQGIVLNI